MAAMSPSWRSTPGGTPSASGSRPRGSTGSACPAPGPPARLRAGVAGGLRAEDLPPPARRLLLDGTPPLPVPRVPLRARGKPAVADLLLEVPERVVGAEEIAAVADFLDQRERQRLVADADAAGEAPDGADDLVVQHEHLRRHAQRGVGVARPPAG